MQRRTVMRLLMGGMLALAVWGQQAVASPMWDIESKTKEAAPDGTHDDRTKIGALEKVDLNLTNPPQNSSDAIWTAVEDGIEVDSGTGPTFTYTASELATRSTISCTIGGIKKSKDFTVFWPQSVTAIKNPQNPDYVGYANNEQGAGMNLICTVQPSSCYFGGIPIKELTCSSTESTGYWVRHPQIHPAGNAIALSPKNQFSDRVGQKPPGYHPWVTGKYTWSIPMQWTPGGAIWVPVCTNNQTCNWRRSNGSCSFTKFGVTTTPRTPTEQ